MGYLHNDAEGVASNRIGGGHAEGYFESWANLYHRFALAFQAANNDDQETLANLWYPGIDAGIEGVRLCEKCVESADQNATWVDYK